MRLRLRHTAHRLIYGRLEIGIRSCAVEAPIRDKDPRHDSCLFLPVVARKLPDGRGSMPELGARGKLVAKARRFAVTFR